MTFLLDVNVLVALLDLSHIDHTRAHLWFNSLENDTWATCPITENAVLRIIGRPRYRNSPGSPAEVAPYLAALRNLSGHQFWVDELSLIDSKVVRVDLIQTYGSITDTYLLALAAAKGGRLATFDSRLQPDAVHNGDRALHLIP